MGNRLGAHDDFQEKTQFFISVGDLMSAVLLVFVFLLAATLLKIQDGYGQKAAMADTYQQAAEENLRASEGYRSKSEAYKRPAAVFHQLQNDFYLALDEEFKGDLERWGATIDRDSLSIRFLEPEVLFGSGKANLTRHFETILNDFFPRYIAMLASAKFRDDIEEIRIEGHTSSEWDAHPDTDRAYFDNMRLSMNRTWNVLEYCLGRLDQQPLREWVEGRVTANGLSSSRPILVNGVEDRRMSRRVEFRVRVAAEKRIGQILTAAGEDEGESAREAQMAIEAIEAPFNLTCEPRMTPELNEPTPFLPTPANPAPAPTFETP